MSYKSTFKYTISYFVWLFLCTGVRKITFKKSFADFCFSWILYFVIPWNPQILAWKFIKDFLSQETSNVCKKYRNIRAQTRPSVFYKFTFSTKDLMTYTAQNLRQRYCNVAAKLLEHCNIVGMICAIWEFSLHHVM